MTDIARKNIARLLRETTETTPVEKLFVRDLRRSIELTDAKNAHKPSQTYKPSSLHCIRNMYYQVTGHEEDTCGADAVLVGICESGTDRHERVQNAVSQMRSNGIDCDYVDVAEYVRSRQDVLPNLRIVDKVGNETKLYDEKLNVSFLCDGIIRYLGKYYILEIKTESIYKWQNRADVNEDHILQGTAYSKLLGIEQVLFLYINRDNCDMKGFMLDVTDSMREALVGKISECDFYVQSNHVPPKPEDVSKKACQYCSYAKSCKEAG